LSELKLGRRRFIKSSLFIWLSFFLPLRREEIVLRPIGADKDFLFKCIRCGKCGEACPYDSIKFFGIAGGASIGTPYINPLDTPCYLCLRRVAPGRDEPISRYLKCGEACPTGALRKIRNDREVLLSLPQELKMGTSTLDRDICLAWQYDSCGECYYNCPLKDDAMLDYPPGEIIEGAVSIRPTVNEEKCVGCGMCNYVCPVKEEIAESYLKGGKKLTYFEERYSAMVRNVIGRAGKGKKYPAVRVRRRL
jgi:ferredoxin-type protein NapG